MRLFFLFLFALLQRKAAGSNSQHAQPTLMSSDLVKITTLNDSGNGSSDNDSTKYTLQDDGYVFYYTFKERARCVRCEYAGMTIWEQGLGIMFPTAISFHSDLFMVFVQFQDFVKMYSFKQDLSDPENPRGQFLFLAQTETKGVSPSKMRFLLREKSDPSNAQLRYLDGINQGFQFEYEFKDFDCLEVQYANNSVWKHDSQVSEGQLPQSVHLNIYTNMIFVTMSDFYLVYQCSSDKCDLLCRSTLSGFSENDLKFLTKGSDGSMSQLDSSKFDLMKYPDGFTYVFSLKDDANCSQLKYKENVLWSARNNGLPAKSVYVNLSVKSLMIETGDSLLVFMHFDQWKLIFTTGPDAGPVFTPKGQTPDDSQSHLRGQTFAQTPAKIHDEQPEESTESKASGDSKPSKDSKDPDGRKLNTMTIMLILCGVILTILFLAVLFKLCIK